jgi:hypothetical protein
MLSGLPQESHGSERTSRDHPDARLPEEPKGPEQQTFSKDPRTASGNRDARGYVDAATAQGEDSATYEATEIFEQSSNSSKTSQQNSSRNATESRARVEKAGLSTSLFPSRATGVFEADSSKEKSPSTSSRRASSIPLVSESREEVAVEGARPAAAKSGNPPPTSLLDKLQRYLPALLILNALLLITLILLLTLPGIPN